MSIYNRNWANLQRSLGFLAWVVTSEDIKVHPTTEEDYEGALLTAKDNNVSANDALVHLSMKAQELSEIYSFDKHFDQLKGITRLSNAIPQ